MSEAAENATTTETVADPAPARLDLGVARTIALKFASRLYTWTFRRIERNDWEQFFRSFETETTNILGEQTETFEIESGLVELARSCVVKVEGYKMPAAGDWRSMLPLGHLKAYAQVLRDVHAEPTRDDAPFALSDLSEVSLSCIWSGDRWTGLVHRFRQPTLQEQKDYHRAASTYRIVGNDRGNRTIYPARQALMMDFYDKLIESVDESYCVRGEALTAREAIVREMDCSHKVAAIQGLLNAGGAGQLPPVKKAGDGAQ